MPVIGTRGGRAASGLGFNGDGFTPQALALFARMSPTPSPSRKVYINRLISSLVGAGVWSKLDMLQVYAADAQANALLNWVSTSYNASAVSSPTFTADRGFTGNGSSSYLDTGYNASLASGWTQNSHTFGRWLRSGTAGGTDFGAEDTLNLRGGYIQSNIGVDNYVTYDSGTTDSQSTSPIGNITVTRSIAGSFDVYKDGVFVTTKSAASRQAANLNMYALCRNLDSVASGFSDSQTMFVYAGAGMTGADILALQNALQAYKTAVGA